MDMNTWIGIILLTALFGVVIYWMVKAKKNFQKNFRELEVFIINE